MIALIIVSWMMKAMNEASLSYHIRILDLKVNQLRGNNPEYDITKHLFTRDMRLCKIKIINK